MKGDEERNEAYARCEAARGVWFEGREGRRTSVALAKGDALRMGILVSSLALATGCDMAIDNSIASLWNSFWQGPKVGGVLFGAILLVSLFAIRTFKVYRARVSNGNKFKKVSDKYKGRRLKRNPNGTDKYAHVKANTMSLGVRKLFKTGAPYDNGVMTHE